MILAIGSFIWAYFLGNGDFWQYALICAVSGIALGAELTLPPSILADLLPSEDNASGHFSLMTFLAKTALAIASGAMLLLLDVFNYQPAGDNSNEALHWLNISYALIPCSLKFLSAVLLWSWFKSNQLTGDSHVSFTHTNRSHHNA